MAPSMQRTGVPIHILPVEVQRFVLLQLPKKAILVCRLVCRHFLSLATEIAFRHIELQAVPNHSYNGTPPNIKSFIQISKAEHLRSLVREVTLDAFVVKEASDYSRQLRFLWALPRLACFRNLRTLNIRFSKHVPRDQGARLFPNVGRAKKSTKFRLDVLYFAFSALSGVFTDGALVNDGSPLSDHVMLYPKDGYRMFPSPIGLEELTISNLSPYDTRLIDSNALRTILAAPSFRSLKLLVTRVSDRDNLGHHLLQRENYDIYRELPSKLLSPAVAQNLRVLSLYDLNYWGWCPVMDFRAINPNGGGLPNLRVLALGKHVFSHDWQVDWIAGLANAASTTPSGGLEELYLDDCPIMWHASIRGPQRSNAGYWYRPDGELEDVSFRLRWHHVLPRWRDAFAGSRLRVFSMGHGDWKGDAQVREDAYERRGERVFLNYDLPPPRKSRRGRFAFRYSYNPRKCEHPCGVRPRYGVGLRRARHDVMQYIQFDAKLWPKTWVEDTGIDKVESDTRILDDKALEDFMETLDVHWSEWAMTSNTL
ncbi:hypothetical protein RB595_001499 [Gaeumannomyces hyphopodioides]